MIGRNSGGPIGRQSGGTVGRASTGTVGRTSTGTIGRVVGAVGRFAQDAAKDSDLEAELAKDMDGLLTDLEAADRPETMGEMMKRVAAQLDAEVNTDYYLCMVFQSQEQKDAFLAKLNWDGYREGTMYVSGTRLAKAMGIPLPAGPVWKESKPKTAFVPFAIKPGEKG